MKNIVKKIEHLGQKAAQVQHAVGSVPGKIAEIREAVALTKGQLQQLRTEVQSSVADLRLESEDRLLAGLMEINGGAEAFEEGGYQLVGVDLELSPAHKIIVHLRKVEEVAPSVLRSLVAANQNRKTLCALLASLAKAEEVANKVDMRDLHYSEVIIHVGPAPTIRLCWRPDHMERDNPVSKASPAALVLAATPPRSAFTQSTFFERRSPAPLTSSEVELHPAPALTSPAPGPAAASHGSIQQSPGLAEKASPSEVRTDWKQDALQRFKKMPDVSKYRR